MEKTREGNYFTETHRECTKCGDMFERIGKDTMRICKKCNTSRVKCLTPERKMYQRAKRRAKVQNLQFNLEFSDIIIPEYCPILGIKLEPQSGQSGGRKQSPALDKIDPSKGYTKGNIWVISHLANQMKSHASNEELKKFSEFFITNSWVDLTNQS